MAVAAETPRKRAREIGSALKQCANPVKRDTLLRFFKTDSGEYGEGDCFLGVVVPDIRKLARQYREEPLSVAGELLKSPWHECRLCALLMLVERFKKANAEGRQEIFDFYLTQTEHINNWDLVDLSAPPIVGAYLSDKADKAREVLCLLAQDSSLWNRRIAIVSTLFFIRNNNFDETLRLAEYFLAQAGKMHDLLQKAIGWMLREVGKRDKNLLVRFLEKYASTMPRTTLRYSIEKFSAEERKIWMNKRQAPTPL